MSAPTVACVLLASGRPEMVKRAVASFRAQTYKDAYLFVYDTGERPVIASCGGDNTDYVHFSDRISCSIGWLRNLANERAGAMIGADIICHWDSDDWSHPNRIAEQVALLQSSGAECVGYNEMLFWREFPSADPCYDLDEAWLWRENIKNYAVGTSMMYWRETWERAPFPDYSEGCDDLYWAHGDKKKGIAAVKIVSESGVRKFDPRMIASIHGGNTCAKIDAKQSAWRRAPEWDSYCREAMCLSGS